METKDAHLLILKVTSAHVCLTFWEHSFKVKLDLQAYMAVVPMSSYQSVAVKVQDQQI